MAEKKQFIVTEPTDKIKFLAEPHEEQKTILKITNQSEMKQAFKLLSRSVLRRSHCLSADHSAPVLPVLCDGNPRDNQVKCTRNDLFRIKPSTGILDYNQTLTIVLIYKGGLDKVPAERQHFGVYHIPAPENCTCEGAWAEHYGPPQGEHKLRVVWNE